MDKYVCVSKIINASKAIQIGVGPVDRPAYFVELHKLHCLNDYASSDLIIRVSKYAYDRIDTGDTLCLPIATYNGTDTNFIVIKET